MRATLRHTVSWTLCAWLCASPLRAQPAPAQPSSAAAQPAASTRVAEAQQHILRALEAFQTRDYVTAIHEFELSYRAAPDANIWYNLARARELSGDYEGAVADYQRYLRDKVDPPDRDDVQRTIATLSTLVEQRAATQRRQAEGSQLRVQVPPTTANPHLLLDGESLALASAGDPRRVATGNHAVRLTSENRQDWAAQVRVREGETAVVFPAPAPATRYVSRPRSHVVSWVLAGLGGASLVGAGVFAIRAAGDDCDACNAAIRDSNRSDVLLGVGSGLLVGAAVAWFVERASAGTERVTSP